MKFDSDRDSVVAASVATLRRALEFSDDVQFGLEDATRADPAFLADLIKMGIAEGATTITVADTVGYATPFEMAGLLTQLQASVPETKDVVLAVHCHDDLGMAVANSLAGVRAGARQVECAVNGIGERAGNASLEEVVMALKTRSVFFGCSTGVKTTALCETSRVLSDPDPQVAPG